MISVITAEGIASMLAPNILTTVHVGAARPVAGLDLAEPGVAETMGPGDLVVVVGARDLEDVRELVADAAASAGLVLRKALAEEPGLVELCRQYDVTLLALADDATLSATIALLHDLIDQATRNSANDSASGSVYSDLFAMADTLSVLLGAPVTVEDPRSRVLAYSTGQQGVDDARTSTIVGRQVPQAVRDHFRSLGVFRRLAASDEAFYVPSGEAGVKPRLVVPVRAGGEWLGSVWAVVEDEPSPELLVNARASADVLAVHLLRLRALGDLDRQLQRERLRALLEGKTSGRPNGLGDGPWRAVVLRGPRADLEPEERAVVWTAMAQRRGWRRPMLTELSGLVCAVVTTGVQPGSWSWLQSLVESEQDLDLGLTAGRAVAELSDVAESAAQARQLYELVPATGAPAVRTIDVDWAPVVLARAMQGIGSTALVSPVVELAASDRERGGDMVATLCAVIDHWGEPRRSARALGVHPNTIRNRMARLGEQLTTDLEDPAKRLALRLEAYYLTGRGLTGLGE